MAASRGDRTELSEALEAMSQLAPLKHIPNTSARDLRLVSQATRHREIPLIKDTSDRTFRCLWMEGIPVIASLTNHGGSWDPEYFTGRYGSQTATMLVHCRDGKIKSLKVKLAGFFEEFTKSSREDVVKIKVNGSKFV